MMKEICAQCLQPHVDPATGKTTYVFSCFNQDQPLDQVDFAALAQRLAQNGVQEKLTALWIGRCLKLLPAAGGAQGRLVSSRHRLHQERERPLRLWNPGPPPL